MKDFIITTDSTSDLPLDYVTDNNIEVLPVPYSIDGTVYGHSDNDMDILDFYQAMRDGIMPTTMACNIEECANMFTKYAKQGIDILHLAFSSGLSSTYSNAVLAANDVMEEYPDCKITVVDTLGASAGEGLIVYLANELKKEGMSLEDVASWVEDNRQYVNSRFTVDDLHHLHRGGRVSKTTAIVGSLINVKPILHVDEEGYLKSLENVRGRKKSLLRLVDMMEEGIKDYNTDKKVAFITHGDCEEDAKFVANEIEKRVGYKVIINILSQTIGTHTGPNLVALFYMGNKR